MAPPNRLKPPSATQPCGGPLESQFIEVSQLGPTPQREVADLIRHPTRYTYTRLCGWTKYLYNICMAKDIIHQAVKNALIKDGWTITADPYPLRFEDKSLMADLKAERVLLAQRDSREEVIQWIR